MIVRLGLGAALLVALVPLHLSLGSGLPLAEIWPALGGAEPDGVAAALLSYAAGPRVVVAVLAGAALGLAGSVLQQVTRNRLVSPLTIGASSGAWLALVAGAVAAPALAAAHGIWFAMGGALASTGLVLVIAGRNGITGLPVVLAGMAVNLLLQAVATVVVLTNGEAVRGLFIWGAGDLTQTGWDWAAWLWPQVLGGVVVLLLCTRPLMLLKLGTEAAAGRGLALLPVLLVAVLAALWLTASVITAVGVIGFIGLLAPALARMTGARSAGGEMLASLVLGALVLLATDALALFVGQYTRDLVPSGAAAALVGVPVLIGLTLGRLRAQDHAPLRMPEGAARLRPGFAVLVAAGAVALVLASLTLAPTAEGWRMAWPSDLVLSLRWPRLLAAAAAGAGMALAGVVLQRLLRNPLASPDIIGISSGATLALVGAVVLLGGSIHDFGAPVALLGGLGALGVLLMLGRRQGHAPAAVALVGIALAALLDAVLQMVLARGGADAVMIVGWIAGSTARVTEGQALALAASVLLLAAAAVAAHRWLTLLAGGEAFAAGRGLAVGPARTALLALGAVTAAAVTAVVGPIAFVGLIAPHLAALLGAQRSGQHLMLACGLGVVLMVLSDWLGRTMLHPVQLPAGAMASVIGGGYFLMLLLARRGGIAAGRAA
ncbi:transport system permease protein [Caenispirillum salinarum AK4]|uniref:Transport system permease protein n=1 Tax=Caenispirillum salinarum AK4 TaxID=1238182 RepID=K9H5B8_9PROT|nr:Fe(3+)-hydroxamate ABC transporter permease FhuB [Caenispirillum salinarum]EKV32279.1 transport system permease protein [Caenispirillum salinarum AK4]